MFVHRTIRTRKSQQHYDLSLKVASKAHINKGECTGCEASMSVKTFY